MTMSRTKKGALATGGAVLAVGITAFFSVYFGNKEWAAEHSDKAFWTVFGLALGTALVGGFITGMVDQPNASEVAKQKEI